MIIGRLINVGVALILVRKSTQLLARRLETLAGGTAARERDGDFEVRDRAPVARNDGGCPSDVPRRSTSSATVSIDATPHSKCCRPRRRCSHDHEQERWTTLRHEAGRCATSWTRPISPRRRGARAAAHSPLLTQLQSGTRARSFTLWICCSKRGAIRDLAALRTRGGGGVAPHHGGHGDVFG